MYLDGLLVFLFERTAKKPNKIQKNKKTKKQKDYLHVKKYISSYFPCEILSISNVYLGDNRLLNLVITL